MTHFEKYDSHDWYLDPESGILRNKLGITEQEELDAIEYEKLLEAYETASTSYDDSHRFDQNDINHLHRLFLGEIYDWAGEYRTVDLISGDIRWCHAMYIGQEMKILSKTLIQYTPFYPKMNKQELLEKLATIHGELIMIHPYRDGNGRVTRLLSDLLLMQSQLNPISAKNFYDQNYRNRYHTAIRDIWRKAEYHLLIQMFDELIFLNPD